MSFYCFLIMKTRKTQKHLYDFIRLMSKDEKKYFTHKNRGKQTNKSITLFKLIVNNIGLEYSEIDDLVKVKFTSTKNISKLKNQLYHQLLDLTTSHSIEKNLSRKFRVQLNKIDLLYEKGLSEAALKLLNETLKQAKKNEENDVLLQLYQYKLKINLRLNKGSKVIVSIEEEGRATIKHLENEFESSILNAKIFSLYKMSDDPPRSSDLDKKNKELYQQVNHLLKKDINFLSFKTKFNINQFLSQYYLYYNDLKQEYLHAKLNYLLFKSDPSLKKHNPSYVNAINNYAISCSRLNKNELSIELLETLYALVNSPSFSEYKKISIFQNVSANLLDNYLITGKINNRSKFIEEIETGLKKHNKHIQKVFKSVILNNLAEYYFWHKEYKKAKKCISLILLESYDQARLDVVRFTYYFNLIIHYELHDYEYLEHLLRTIKTSKFLQHKTAIEIWFLNFIREVLNIETTAAVNQQFLQTQEIVLIKVLIKDEEEQNFKSFNPSIWLRLKTEKLTLEEVMEEYNKKGSEKYFKDRLKILIMANQNSL